MARGRFARRARAQRSAETLDDEQHGTTADAPARLAAPAPTHAVRPDAPVAPGDVPEIQRLAGNRAVLDRLVISRQAPGGTATPAPPAGTATTTAPAAADPPIEWIAELPAHIQRQIDLFTEARLAAADAQGKQRLLDQRARNRKAFMHTMRWLFGSDAATEAHFRDIKPMGNSAKWPLWLHVSARERLQEVQADLEAQGHPMPNTSVGLGLRGRHVHREDKGPGYFTHATGFAIDWKATAAPHILGAEGAKLSALFGVVTGATTHFELGLSAQKRLDLIEAMGQGKAAKADADAFLASIEREYKKLSAASAKFKTDLPKTSLDLLRALTVEVDTARSKAGAARQRLAGLRRKRRTPAATLEEATTALATAVTTYEDTLRKAEAQLPTIFAPWTKLLDDRIGALEQQAAKSGVSFDLLAGDYYFKEQAKALAANKRKQLPLIARAKRVLAEVVRIERQAAALAARVQAARAWLAAPTGRQPDAADVLGWSAALDTIEEQLAGVTAGLAPVNERLEGLLPGAVVPPKPAGTVRPTALSDRSVASLERAAAKLPVRVTAAADQLAKVAQPLADLRSQAAATSKEVAERKAYKAARVEALGGSAKRGKGPGDKAVDKLLLDKLEWLRLKGAKEGLERNAHGFVFKASVDDDSVRNPAIVQLLGMRPGTRGGGFFTPDPESGGKPGAWSSEHGFNLAFFKSMVSHGFELGVAWQGQADTMHFELVEGRRLLESGGSRALTAGATLRAEEEKAAAEKAAADRAAAEKAAADKAAADRASAPPTP